MTIKAQYDATRNNGTDKPRGFVCPRCGRKDLKCFSFSNDGSVGCRGEAIEPDRWVRRSGIIFGLAAKNSDGHFIKCRECGRHLGECICFGDAKDDGIGEPPAPSRWPDPVPISQLPDSADSVDWIVEGIFAKRHLTLVNALAKAGKTTWTSILYRSLQDGTPFIGRKTRKCKTLVVSEESATLWRGRRDALGLDDSLSLLCKPMMGKPTQADWASFMLHVRDKAEGFDLVLIDTIATFAPWKSENDSAEITAAFLPFNLLTEAGLAVGALHHIGKSDQSEGKAARGSSAFAAAVDIILEFRRYKADDRDDRRRVITGLGRFDEIPEEVVIQLSADGTNYSAEGDRKAMAARELHTGILAALPTDPPGLKADDIHESLPEIGRPQRSAVSAALKAGAGKDWQTGGTGKRGDPKRYWRSE